TDSFLRAESRNCHADGLDPGTTRRRNLQKPRIRPAAGREKKELRPMARSFTGDFLSSLPRVRELLQTDVEAAYNGDPAALTREEVIVAYPFVEAIAVQRIAQELYRKRIPLIPRIMTEWAHSRTGMDLHPGA